MPYDRMDRIDEEVRRELMNLIQFELKDPRISPLTSIMAAEVTRDLRYAKVRISVMGNEKQLKDTLKGLKQASSFLRRELGHRIQLRAVPELLFVPDDSIEHSVHIAKLLQEVLPDEPPDIMPDSTSDSEETDDE